MTTPITGTVQKYRMQILPRQSHRWFWDINSDNFKNTVAKAQGHDRSHVYSNVWEDLLVLEKEES